MLSINRFTAPVVHAWQTLPRGSTPVFLTAVSILLAKRVSSDYRIRAAIVLGTASIAAIFPSIVKKVYDLFFFEFEVVRQLVQPEVLPKDPSSYLSLLPEPVLRQTGTYIDYATYRTWDQRPLDSALHAVREGYRIESNAEVVARRALALEGVPFCPYVGETALENWKRYQAVLATESRLLQGVTHSVRVKKMGPSAYPLLVRGPLLVLNEPRGYVAYHWPTGAVKWIQPDRVSLKLIDLLTGQRITQGWVYNTTKELDQIEILEPRRLINHSLKQEIHLTQNCDTLLSYKHPILFFENEQGIWVKNGDASEILTELPKPFFSLSINLVQTPYFIATYSTSNGAGQGVYHMKDGKQILTIPLRVALQASIRQRMDFSSEPPVSKDELFYVTLTNNLADNQFIEVSVSLQNPANKQIRRLKNYKFASWTSGATHIDLAPWNEGYLYSPQRPISHFQIEKVAGLIYYFYNQYLLISQRADGNLFDHFVLDLAEQSFTAERV